MHTIILLIIALAIWADLTAIALGKRTPIFYIMLAGIFAWAWLAAHFMASDQAAEDQAGDQEQDLAA